MFNLSDAKNCYSHFFFKEDYTYNLSVFRIMFLGLVFVYTLFEIGNISDFYGPAGLVSLEIVKQKYSFPHLNVFHFFRDTNEVAYLIYYTTLISLLMALIGYKTRFFLIISYIGISSLQMRNIWVLSSADVLIRCIFFILIFSPCFRFLSVDSVIQSRKGIKTKKKEVQWTWRLIQIQVSVVYLWTCWHKLKGDTWFDGSAVYYATRLDTMKNMTIPFILDNRTILIFMTWSTLFIEFGLGFFVWFKQTRTIFIIAGIGLHIGIEFLMAIPFFEWLMILLLMTFYTPKEYVAFLVMMKNKLKILGLKYKTSKESWRDYETV